MDNVFVIRYAENQGNELHELVRPVDFDDDDDLSDDDEVWYSFPEDNPQSRSAALATGSSVEFRVKMYQTPC